MQIGTPQERFEDKIFYSPDGCWYWTAGLTTTGYGIFWTGKKFMKAHRFSYELYKAKIPKSKNPQAYCILHKCDNPLCVNPDHLALGSMQDNSSDMVKKRRHRIGASRPAAKLTDEQVIMIRDMIQSKSRKEIAMLFNISVSVVSSIKCRKAWTHIA